MVPPNVQSELIAWDIFTHLLRAPANTFTIQLLSDMEFLLFKGPQSGRGISWDETIAYI